MSEFTKEEVGNLVVLVEQGARTLSAQQKLEQASAVLSVADQLIKKILELAPKEEVKDVVG